MSNKFHHVRLRVGLLAFNHTNQTDVCPCHVQVKWLCLAPSTKLAGMNSDRAVPTQHAGAGHAPLRSHDNNCNSGLEGTEPLRIPSSSSTQLVMQTLQGAVQNCVHNAIYQLYKKIFLGSNAKCGTKHVEV